MSVIHESDYIADANLKNGHCFDYCRRLILQGFDYHQRVNAHTAVACMWAGVNGAHTATCYANNHCLHIVCYEMK